MLQNMPHYTNSKVWQDMIKFKATMRENASTTDAGSNSLKGGKFSIRTPINLSKLHEMKTQSQTSREQNTMTQFMTTKNTTTGFFPMVSPV